MSMCGGQRTTFGSQFSPYLDLQAWHQETLFLSHPVSPKKRVFVSMKACPVSIPIPISHPGHLPGVWITPHPLWSEETTGAMRGFSHTRPTLIPDKTAWLLALRTPFCQSQGIPTPPTSTRSVENSLISEGILASCSRAPKHHPLDSASES